MTGTRLFSIVFGANDHIALARFWARALEVEVAGEREDEAWIQVPDSIELNFVPIPERKTSKNRIHLDLHSESAEHHAANVERLLALGATRADIGQGDVAWTVLADPEGNEFCVLPRPGTGPVAAIAHDAVDAATLGRFWSEAAGWTIVDEGGWGMALRAPSGTGPFLTFGGGTERTAPKPAKNRLHLDVAPPPGGDHHAEAERLTTIGARIIDIGQGDVPWVVLSDPEDNEFCVLTPR